MENDTPISSGVDERRVDGAAEMVVARAVEETPASGAVAAVSAIEAMALGLSPAQRKAIELLTSGHTVVDAAMAAGVGRATLYRWLKGDAQFVAAFNAWQQDAIATARGRLLSLSDLAVVTVGKAMSRGDAKVAVAVLKAMGVMDRPSVGPTDAEEVKRIQEVEAKEASASPAKRETAQERWKRMREMEAEWRGGGVKG